LFCPERKLPSDLFVEAARDIDTLLYAEPTALTKGAKRASVESFDVALVAARRKKDRIKLAYLLHVEVRGCGEQGSLQSIKLATNSRSDVNP
jgi:hypothetical protein